MKMKILISIIVVICLLILLVPIPQYAKDGGTVEYTALTYKILKVHSLRAEGEGYLEGTVIEILGFEVFNNVK